MKSNERIKNKVEKKLIVNKKNLIQFLIISISESCTKKTDDGHYICAW